MKNFFSLTLAMALGLSMFNCGNDDSDNNDNNNNNNPTNALVYNGEEHQIQGASLLNYGEYFDSGVYNFDVSLIDSEISIVDGYPEAVNNVYSEIYFELFTESEAGLEPGTYAFDPTYGVANTFVGDVLLNYNYETDEEEAYYEMTSGTFTVLENGTAFKLEFEGTTEDGAAFSGSYEGELMYFEDLTFWQNEGRPSGVTKTKGFSRRK
ncbi:hypothetical protein [Mangrovimonas sp. TPBH4]|uniref:hypothetical protein n=1 Tax=Mangrovimonas sp. TPBH4 TaxID=1645914 RepID=UPI000B135A31|nr:hypothetical protein [Mangrovimonas sp. TPBH4]